MRSLEILPVKQINVGELNTSDVALISERAKGERGEIPYQEGVWYQLARLMELRTRIEPLEWLSMEAALPTIA
jgi:hypothetical protein